MKRGSSILLMLVVYFVGVAALALFVFFVPAAAREIYGAATLKESWFDYSKYLFLACSYAVAIPFFYALYQILKFISYIDNDEAFSEIAVKALKYIKYCTIIISMLLVAGGMPAAYIMAQSEDAPGLILFSFAFFCSPIAIAAFADTLQRLLQQGINLKSEKAVLSEDYVCEYRK